LAPLEAGTQGLQRQLKRTGVARLLPKPANTGAELVHAAAVAIQHR
jgi:hypothetical protein